MAANLRPITDIDPRFGRDAPRLCRCARRSHCNITTVERGPRFGGSPCSHPARTLHTSLAKPRPPPPSCAFACMWPPQAMTYGAVPCPPPRAGCVSCSLGTPRRFGQGVGAYRPAETRVQAEASSAAQDRRRMSEPEQNQRPGLLWQGGQVRGVRWGEGQGGMSPNASPKW